MADGKRSVRRGWSFCLRSSSKVIFFWINIPFSFRIIGYFIDRFLLYNVKTAKGYKNRTVFNTYTYNVLPYCYGIFIHGVIWKTKLKRLSFTIHTFSVTSYWSYWDLIPFKRIPTYSELLTQHIAALELYMLVTLYNKKLYIWQCRICCRHLHYVFRSTEHHDRCYSLSTSLYADSALFQHLWKAALTKSIKSWWTTWNRLNTSRC